MRLITKGLAKKFSQTFEAKEQKFSHLNVMFSDSIMDAILFSIPGFFKSAAQNCIVAVLDEDVRRCNGQVTSSMVQSY